MIDVCDKFLEFDSGNVIPLDYDLKKQMTDAVTTMAMQALRTIGLCYKEVNIEEIDTESVDERGIFEYEKNGYTMVGICGIKDIIRAEVPKSIRSCH